MEDVVSAHLLAAKHAPAIGFRKYIISATTPFHPDDLAALRVDAPRVVRQHIPEYEAEYVSGAAGRCFQASEESTSMGAPEQNSAGGRATTSPRSDRPLEAGGRSAKSSRPSRWEQKDTMRRNFARDYIRWSVSHEHDRAEWAGHRNLSSACRPTEDLRRACVRHHRFSAATPSRKARKLNAQTALQRNTRRRSRLRPVSVW